MSTRLSGNLAKLNFSEIIKATCLKAKSCQLIVRNSIGEGTIFFAQGEPLHAQMGNMEGTEAIHRLLASIQKEGGVFTVDFDIKVPERTISQSWNAIIDVNNNNNNNNNIEKKEKESNENVPIKNVTIPEKTQKEQPQKVEVSSKKEESMTKSRGQQISKLLNDLQKKSSDIQGTAVVSTEGLVISSVLNETFEEEHLAAISAIVLSLGERIVTELSRGELEQVFVKGKNGYVLIHQCSPEALLAVVTSNFVKLGMIFLDTKRTAENLAEFL